MAQYKIYPMELGYFPDHDEGMLTYMKGHGKKGYSPILAYLIQGNGLNIMVDTGPSDSEFAEKYHHTVIKDESMTVPGALKKFGIGVDDIDFLINTHLHWDHTFGNEYFVGKKVYVQKREFDFAMDPWRLFDSSYEHWRTGRIPPWACSIPYFEFVYGDKEIVPGIELVTLPGHSPGSQGVLVDTCDGKYLIAGDCIGSYSCWETEGHIVGAVHSSVKEYLETYEKMDKMGFKMLLPGHDGKVLEHSVYPVENDD